jgi:hypothetical protein
LDLGFFGWEVILDYFLRFLDVIIVLGKLGKFKLLESLQEFWG